MLMLYCSKGTSIAKHNIAECSPFCYFYFLFLSRFFFSRSSTLKKLPGKLKLLRAQHGGQGPGQNGCVVKNRKTTYQRLARIYGFPYIGIKCLGKQNLDAQGATRTIRAGLQCIYVRGGSGWYVAWQYWLYLHLQAKTEKARIREENDRIKKKERELKEAEKERKRIEALGVYYCIFLLQLTGQLLPCLHILIQNLLRVDREAKDPGCKTRKHDRWAKCSSSRASMSCVCVCMCAVSCAYAQLLMHMRNLQNMWM